jgi:lipopolysaccharide assembly outer membrane protein LptD (OstA)
MHSYFFKKNIGKRFLLLHLAVCLVFMNLKSEDSIVIRDTIDIQNKTLEKKKKSGIDDVISYKASDSIVFYANGKGFLYGKGTIHYKEIELKADYIEMDTDSSQVYASGVTDSIGNITGFPVFKEGKDTYEARSIKYNFNTKKGYITHAVTQQGEGYVVSEKTKKTADDILCMKDGRYTTCSDHDHPHFYLNLTKAKVKPKSYIVTGPAYLVLADVPLPLIIPFGYFPFNDTYSSGIIMPTYGDELSRGFYLKDGGYYFAINDYFDFALTGDIYTKGSWGIKGASSYIKRYKFRGSFSTSYLENLDGEKDLPNFSKSKDFSINWTHTQDPKANLYRTLSASVNFATSSYDRNSIESRYKPNHLSQNTKSSSISIIQRFPESPWSISANMSANQRTQDSTINLNLPDLNLTMSRIYPLKRKNAIGKEKWYEKISMSYSGRFSNSITSKEKELANASFLEDWRNAVKHNIPISASFTIFKYLTITHL